jgi:hypothetical protein
MRASKTCLYRQALRWVSVGWHLESNFAVLWRTCSNRFDEYVLQIPKVLCFRLNKRIHAYICPLLLKYAFFFERKSGTLVGVSSILLLSVPFTMTLEPVDAATK